MHDVSDSGAVIETDVTLDFGRYVYTLSTSKTGIEIKEGSSVKVLGGVFKASKNNESLESLFKSDGALILSDVSVVLSDSTLNAIETSKGQTIISGKTSIAVETNSNIFVAGGSSVVAVSDNSDVSLWGSLSLSGDTDVSFADACLTLTKEITIEGDASFNIQAPIKVAPPVFSSQPKTMNIAPDGSVELDCFVENNGFTVEYQWYKSADGTDQTGVLLDGKTSHDFNDQLSEIGIRYYYCVAKNKRNNGDSTFTTSEESISNVVSVAYTGLPAVYIDTEGVAITSKTEWLEGSTISICGSEDDSWNFTLVSTSIRGRGNSTWNQPKKPYALKLETKQSVMGMPTHKRWVLIANYLDNSFMRNSIAFYLSQQLGLDYTVRGKFVDLVLNGEYQGLYWLGEAIKEDLERVNINKNEDFLIEMDVYFDETWKFYSSVRQMPYMINNDDSMTNEKLHSLSNAISNLEHLLYPNYQQGMDTSICSAPDESYSEVLDKSSWAKFWLVNEIMDNGELGHPKSCYFTYSKVPNTDKWVFKAGPVWDFDWASLHMQSSCRLSNTIYYNALFKSPSFINEVKEIWANAKDNIKIEETISTIKSQIYVAQQYDSMLWGDHLDPSGIKRDGFDEYVNYLKTALINKKAVVNSFVYSLTP